MSNDIIKTQYIRDLPFPTILGFGEDTIVSSMDYRHKDDDIVVASYPKAGSTWLKYIVWQILHRGATYPSISEADRVMPCMEKVGKKGADELIPPRIYKSHLPYYLMHTNSRAKYLYIHRNPKDAMVSMYHFLKQVSQEKFDFDYFFQRWMEGTLWFGDFMHHVMSFYGHRKDENVLFLSYEKMLGNRREGVLKIAKFLGDTHYEVLSTDENLLQKILAVTSFNYMKRNLIYKRRVGSSLDHEITIDFFRKGIIGDGKSLLTAKQSEVLLERTLERMKGTELRDFWISYY